MKQLELSPREPDEDEEDQGSKPRRNKPKVGYQPDFDRMAYEMTKRGLILGDIAKVFNVGSTKTVDRWIENHPSFREAIARGRDDYNSTHVENSLVKRAMGYQYTEETVEKRPMWNYETHDWDEKTITKSVTKEVPPDPNSIFYYLGNRQRDRWSRNGVNGGESINDKFQLTINIGQTATCVETMSPRQLSKNSMQAALSFAELVDLSDQAKLPDAAWNCSGEGKNNSQGATESAGQDSL